MRLGKGGLLGNDASLNAARQQEEERPPQTKTRSSRSGLGAVAPVFGTQAGGVQGQSAIAEPAEPKRPGPIYRKLGETL